MTDEVSKTGVYIDMKTGKVTGSPPEEGIQLVPPGGTIDANTEAQIEAAKAATPATPAKKTADAASAEDGGDPDKLVKRPVAKG